MNLAEKLVCLRKEKGLTQIKSAGIFVASVFLLLGSLLSLTSCSNERNPQAENETQNTIRYAVMLRLDKQNDIYYQLYQLLEDYIVSDDRDRVEAQFKSFCLGVNCFVRNDMIYDYYDQLYQDDQTLLDTIQALTSITAKHEMDTLQISELSDDTLEELKALCYELAKCCDRGKEGTLAYHISIQDFESGLYEEAIRQTNQLLQEFNEITDN